MPEEGHEHILEKLSNELEGVEVTQLNKFENVQLVIEGKATGS